MSKDEDRINQLERQIQELKDELTKLKSAKGMGNQSQADQQEITFVEAARMSLCETYHIKPDKITREWLQEKLEEHPVHQVLEPKRKENEEFEKSLLDDLKYFMKDTESAEVQKNIFKRIFRRTFSR
jgi:hypothetical protein